MSHSKILQLDFKKLFVDYVRITQRRVINENDVTVSLQSLDVIQDDDDDTWRRITRRNRDTTVTHKQVKFLCQTADTQARVYVQERDNFCRITMDNVVIKGLPAETKILIPLDVQELIGEFGTHVEIDACKATFVQKQNKKRDPAATFHEIRMASDATVAHIQSTKKEAKYKFQCTVALDVSVSTPYYNGGYPIDVATVINTMKTKSQYRYLDSVEVTDTEFKFPLSGTGVFRWQCNDHVAWSILVSK